MVHWDFTLNVWTVVVTVIGWLGAIGVLAWKLGAWVEALNSLRQVVQDLLERFNEHDVKDDKRFDGLASQVHQVQIEQARLSGKVIR